MGHWCFNVLLATSNCRGVAWFLITHKFGMGRKVLTSVTIFQADESGAQDDRDYPSLRWTVKDFYPELEDEAASVQDAHPLPYP